jgi:HAE1 family hydrophobic/amphiphilic exporter-1
MKRHCSRIRGRASIVLILAALCPAILMAVPGKATEQVRALTLDEALQITLENNKDIQKAEEFRRKVMGIYVEQRAAALPQLTATATGGRSWDEAQAGAQSIPSFNIGPFTIGPIKIPPNVEDKNVGVGLTQPLFTWGQIGAAIRAAKFGIASAADQLRVARQAALRDVSAAFYDVLLAKEAYAIALQNLRQKESHADEARRRYAAGVSTEYDVLAGEVAVENARPDAIRTENLVRTSRDRLRFILSVAEDVDPQGDLHGSIGPVPEYEEVLETAYRRRPELTDLKDRLAFSSELVKVARAGNKPRLDLKASGGYRELTLGPTEYEGKTWSVGLAVTFPFFDGFRTKGRVDQAKSDVSTLKIEEAKTLDAIALQIRDSLNKVRESAGIVQGLSGTVSQAERLLQMAEKGYEYGVKTHLDVEDAELNLVQARGSLASAWRDYLVARVTLTWAMGILGEDQPPAHK